MIDFTIKGTKLPIIPLDTEVSTVSRVLDTHTLKWFNNESKNNQFVSFGLIESEEFKEPYIQFECSSFLGRNYYIIQLSSINRLAKEQGMIPEIKNPELIDFRVKGTGLPVIGEQRYRITNWHDNRFETGLFRSGSNFVSFGVINRNDEVFISAETDKYIGDNFFEFSLADLTKLAIEQKIIPDPRKIKGYKVPYAIPTYNWKENDVVVKDPTAPSYYKLPTGMDSTGINCLPKDIVETWEPVYEDEVIYINHKGIEIKITKESISVENVGINISDLTHLIKPTYLFIKRADGSIPYAVQILDATYKIGCQTFTIDELKKIYDIYKGLQSL